MATVDGHQARDGGVFLRPLANPLSLGFLGLAGASVMLTGLQLGWVPAGSRTLVAVAVLTLAVPAQLIAALLGFLARDAVAATGMGVLACAWLTTGLLSLLGPPVPPHPVLGLALLFLAGAVLVSALVAAAGKLLACLVLATAAARFALTGVHDYVGGTAVQTASGWLGLALCVLAVYAALAFEVEDIRHRTVLPTLRHGPARTAVRAGDERAVGAVHREAGVRQQL